MGWPKPKVLVVDDSEVFQNHVDLDISGEVQLFRARSVDAAWRIIEENRDLDLIAVNACVGSNRPNMTVFVFAAKRCTGAKIIGISPVSRYNRVLMTVGCDDYLIRRENLARAIRLMLSPTYMTS